MPKHRIECLSHSTSAAYSAHCSQTEHLHRRVSIVHSKDASVVSCFLTPSAMCLFSFLLFLLLSLVLSSNTNFHPTLSLSLRHVSFTKPSANLLIPRFPNVPVPISQIPKFPLIHSVSPKPAHNPAHQSRYLEQIRYPMHCVFHTKWWINSLIYSMIKLYMTIYKIRSNKGAILFSFTYVEQVCASDTVQI